MIANWRLARIRTDWGCGGRELALRAAIMSALHNRNRRRRSSSRSGSISASIEMPCPNPKNAIQSVNKSFTLLSERPSTRKIRADDWGVSSIAVTGSGDKKGLRSFALVKQNFVTEPAPRRDQSPRELMHYLDPAEKSRSRYVLAVLASARRALQLPRRGCRGSSGTGRTRCGLSGDDPSRAQSSRAISTMIQ